jgi:hypothetical protein
VDLLVPCLVKTLKPLCVCIDGAHLFLEDDGLRRGGTDECSAPPEVGRAPGGAARLTDVVPEQTGVEAPLGRLEVPKGIVTRAGAVPEGLSFHCGAIDRGESPRAPQSGPWHGSTAIGVHPVAGLVGHQGGGDHPAAMALWRARPVAPRAPRPGVIDQDEVWGRGLHVSDAWSNLGVSCAAGAEGDDLSGVFLGDSGHRHGIVVDIPSAVKRARLAHG